MEQELAGPSPPLLLDVRKKAEFDVSHIPGAVHIDPKVGGKRKRAEKVEKVNRARRRV